MRGKCSQEESIEVVHLEAPRRPRQRIKTNPHLAVAAGNTWSFLMNEEEHYQTWTGGGKSPASSEGRVFENNQAWRAKVAQTPNTVQRCSIKKAQKAELYEAVV